MDTSLANGSGLILLRSESLQTIVIGTPRVSSAALQLLHGGKRPLNVLAGIEIGIFHHDLALAVDHVGRAVRIFGLLLEDDVIALADLGIRGRDGELVAA